MKVLRCLAPYLLVHRRHLLWGGLWLVATGLLALAIPWALGRGVDAIASGDSGGVLLFAGLLAAAALARGGTRLLSRVKFLYSARRVEVDLRRDLLDRLLSRDADFFDEHRTGDLLARFTGDLGNLRMLAGFGIMTLFNTALVYILTLGRLLSLSPSLTFVALLPYPLMLLTVKRISRRLLHHSTLVQEGLGKVSEAVEESVSGQAVIRSQGLQNLRIRDFDRLNEEYLERNLSLARTRSLILPVMTVIGPLGTLLAIFYGGGRVTAGSLTLGELVAFNAYLVQLAWPTLFLGWVLTLLQRATASMGRLEPLLKEKKEMAGAEAREGSPEIVAEGLDFSYGGDPVLRDLSFSVPAGSLVGVAGGTGAGKSTLLQLLAGRYPVRGGRLHVGGEDLAEVEDESYRRQLAVVPQEGRLFSGTIAENLLYGAPGGEEELLTDTARAVCLDEEIASFAEGYETRVGEGGMSLSGGQRQRVSLGRALAKGGSLWLLDDPTSHLDAETAEKVWRNLRPRLEGKTVFLASGRVSLLSRADRVLVLENGRIAEDGTPAELETAGRLYARLLEKEKLREEMEELL